jgi:outer membrane protein assembly factor BamB
LTLSAVLFAAVLGEGTAQAVVPAPLVAATAKGAVSFAAGKGAAGGIVSARVAFLVGWGLRGVIAAKLKLTIVLVLLAALVGAATVLVVSARRANLPSTPARASETETAALPEGDDGAAKPAANRNAVKVDWPQWRGPNRDGVVQGVAVPAQWPRTLKEEWHVPVGEGVASPVVVGGRVYLFTRREDQEIVLCLDLVTGKEQWRSVPYAARYDRDPKEGNLNIGPRSTPTVADGRVYTLGLSGVLSCLDARTGELLWRKDCKPPTTGGQHEYGGSSPLLADGLCIVYRGDGKDGGLTAFDARTGDLKWFHANGHTGFGPISGSPILVDLVGERQVVTFHDGTTVGVSVAAGKKLWAADSRGPGQPHTTPVRYKDMVLVADILQPLRALRLERGDGGVTAREVWKSKNLPLAYSTPVVAGDLVFGMSSRKNGCFFCLDANTGKTLWESDGNQGDYASILNAGSVLLFLTEKGRLLVVRPSATAFEPIGEYQVSDTDTHAHPVFLGDRILIKDGTDLRSYWIERPPAIHPRFLDLQPHANQKLKEGFGIQGNDLGGLPTGEQTLAGVPFRIGEGVIQLTGNGLPAPTKVEGIKVGAKFSRLYVLHATQWGPDKDHIVVGYYTVHYEDNSQVTIPLVYGEDISNWWCVGGQEPPSRAAVAWKGTNRHATESKATLALYMTRWNNPQPGRTVVRIDFTATNKQVAPFCVAMTVEE